jgi:sec-independent protein translocase protein TatA
MLALFNLGGGEIILILAIVLILFGAKKLPELAKGLGQGIKEFKKATHNVSEEVREAMAERHPTVPGRFAPAAIAPMVPESAVTQDPTSPTA